MGLVPAIHVCARGKRWTGATKEIGWGPVGLTEAGQNSCLAPLSAENAVVLHWHGDTFDLPHGAVRLAFNTHYENQAFAHGARALALQFHVEADPRRLEQWLLATRWSRHYQPVGSRAAGADR